MTRWCRNKTNQASYFRSYFVDFQYNQQQDGTRFHGAGCGTFRGGLQSSGSVAQDHPGNPESSTGLTAQQQQLLQIGEPQTDVTQKSEVKIHPACVSRDTFVCVCVCYSHGFTETHHRCRQAQRQSPAGVLLHRRRSLPAGFTETTVRRSG